MNCRLGMGAVAAIVALLCAQVFAQVGVSPMRMPGVNYYNPSPVVAPVPATPALPSLFGGIRLAQGTAPVITPAPVVGQPQVIAQPPVLTQPPAGFDPYYDAQQTPYVQGGAAPGILPGAVNPASPGFAGGINWAAAPSHGSIITPRVGGGHLAGEDVGLTDGYTWAHAIAPLVQTPGASILLGEIKGISYNDSRDDIGANGLIGYRVLGPTTGRIFGGYAGIDYRDIGLVDFTHLAAGLESLGRVWDVRGNAYLVVSDDRKMVPAGIIEAYDGADAEIGLNLLPDSPTVALRVLGGGYVFFGNNDEIYGVRGRVEGRLWNGVIGEVSLQHDDTFDTTLNVALSFLIGGGRFCNNCPPGIAERLGDPFYKNDHVVLQP